MMNFNALFVQSLLITLLLSSCQNENEIAPLGEYDDGVLISNEGNFSDIDGSVAFYNEDLAVTRTRIFESENERPFGGLLQSIGSHDNKAYLIDNFGSRIEIVDVSSFKTIETILSGLSQPRYFVAEGSVGFISNWGPYAEDYSSPESFIAVLDTEQDLIGQKIYVPSRPEGLAISKGKLFVTALASDEITVIDLTTKEKITAIDTRFGPSHFVIDSQENLWVTCTEGFLVEINTVTNKVQNEISIDNIDGKIAIDGAGETIYLLTSTYAPDYSFTETSVIKLRTISQEEPKAIFSSRNLYGIGVDPVTGIIYLANSNSFSGNGTIIRIDQEGQEIDNFPAGRGPNGFVFR